MPCERCGAAIATSVRWPVQVVDHQHTRAASGTPRDARPPPRRAGSARVGSAASTAVASDDRPRGPGGATRRRVARQHANCRACTRPHLRTVSTNGWTRPPLSVASAVHHRRPASEPGVEGGGRGFCPRRVHGDEGGLAAGACAGGPRRSSVAARLPPDERSSGPLSPCGKGISTAGRFRAASRSTTRSSTPGWPPRGTRRHAGWRPGRTNGRVRISPPVAPGLGRRRRDRRSRSRSPHRLPSPRTRRCARPGDGLLYLDKRTRCVEDGGKGGEPGHIGTGDTSVPRDGPLSQ